MEGQQAVPQKQSMSLQDWELLIRRKLGEVQNLAELMANEHAVLLNRIQQEQQNVKTAEVPASEPAVTAKA